MVLDGALEGAMDASGVGRADGAQAALGVGRDVQADVGSDNEWRDWFPEERPSGPRALSGWWRGLPGLGARGSGDRCRGRRHVGRRRWPGEDLLGDSGRFGVIKA